MAPPADAPFAARLNEKLHLLVLAFGTVFLVLNCARPLMDNVDMGWHVAQGRWMATHAAIYRQDLMNYPNGGRALINEYPFFQIVIYEVWRLGWWGLFALTAGVYGLLAAALVRESRQRLMASTGAFTLSLALMLVYFQVAFPLRPHLVTYVGVVATGLYLVRHREAKAWTGFWPLALLQVVWTNCHSAFVLGPLMVGLFGLEMTARHSLRGGSVAWTTARTWAGAFTLILLACLVNPFGPDRFYPPLYQGQLEEIRAYVGEMQPLTGIASSLMGAMTSLAAVAVGWAALRRRDISYSFLFLATMLLWQSLSVLKSWPVFGLFPPLLILSSAAFGRRPVDGSGLVWATLAVNLAVAVFLLMGIYVRVGDSTGVGLPVIWKEYHLARRELPYAAVDWMRAHGIEGRLLHRCEDGGLLQERGYDRGQTFGDTGFGKYDPRMIRIVSLIGERPALLALYAKDYRPDFVLANSLCFRWPYYLRQDGWRMIFYSATGSVWARPGTRPDLSTLTNQQVEAVLLSDIRQHGQPSDPLLFGRELLAMNSNGSEDFAFAQLTGLPAELHRVPWYWEAARIMCFEAPSFSAEHLRLLSNEASSLRDGALTGVFQASCAAQAGDREGARRLLAALTPDQRGGPGGDLLLELANEEHRPEALSLARISSEAELRDGRHWAAVAVAEEQSGDIFAASAAWAKAVADNPDDADLAQRAMTFAAGHHDVALSGKIATRLDIGPSVAR